jgi:hypothetical protein
MNIRMPGTPRKHPNRFEYVRAEVNTARELLHVKR